MWLAFQSSHMTILMPYAIREPMHIWEVLFNAFCPPPSLREEGGLLNSPSAVRPSVRPYTQLT